MKDKRRIIMTIVGVALSGIGDGFIKAAMLGLDPFTGAATGLSQMLGMGYGNFYAIFNFLLLLMIWFVDKHYIGIATLVNMVGIGYMIQYTSEGILRFVADMALSGMGLQLILFFIGILILCAGTSLYFTADLGVSTYDASALILKDKTGHSLKICRIGTDLLCVVVALVFGANIGLGTVITAFCMGPFIEFFNRNLAEPILCRHFIAKRQKIC
ncbi:MAG: Tat pathway signal sequence [Lachnospiraceae bacterium]|nr:Tat pathway signal sequence [Lachnospiraceae bacterium]